ncbi:MAG: autotransporter outer membrane beta-barrel domain-containing protein [Candidatus Protistobacter heckmanni]|nr:autotransporter outer membrane beta-barrel domain-containing protein [Candidatus Protistobacter heckmanni]
MAMLLCSLTTLAPAVDGLSDLGTLSGDTYSYAYGSVVVGTSSSMFTSQRGFRWTQATGIQTVEQWLAANGVTVGAGLVTASPMATNSDASVVVGELDNSHAFLARVTPTGSGLIDTADFNRTLQGSAYAHMQAVAQSDLVLNGMHATRAAELLSAGQRSAWVGGDWGRQDSVANAGDVGTGEVSFGYGINEGVTARIALGRTYSQRNMLYNGNSTIRGTYLVPEVVVVVPSTSLRFSAAGYYNKGDADIRRGYLNAGTPVTLSGSPDAETAGLRLRLDWINAVERGAFALPPYASVTRYHSRIGAYTKTGGGLTITSSMPTQCRDRLIRRPPSEPRRSMHRP